MIDLSQLSRPQVIEPLDYAAILGATVADFKSRWAAKRLVDPSLISVDTLDLETDVIRTLFEATAWRELLIRALANDKAASLLPAFAVGADLDHIALRVGIVRAAGETNVQLLDRYLAAWARPSAGSSIGYLSHALNAWPGRGACRVLDRGDHGRPGDIDIVLAGPGGAAVPDAARLAVLAATTAKDRKAASDVVAVLNASVVTYSIQLRLEVSHGPSPASIINEVMIRAREFRLARYQVGEPIAESAITAIGYVTGVERVINLSPGDRSVGLTEIPWAPDANIYVTAVVT